MNFLFKSKKNSNQLNNNLVTFSTCWYVLKSKFPIEMYLKWINNLLSIVNNFNLVIYTNLESSKYILKLIDKNNIKIKIIIKEIEEFNNYKHKDNWIKNHEKSDMILHKNTDWKLNMLWNEKVFFVNETITKRYFYSLYYGWCDIGYFRNRDNDFHTSFLNKWPNSSKLIKEPFKNVSIHYGCVQNNTTSYLNLLNEIKSHYSNKLCNAPTDKHSENCFAGGFFISLAEPIKYYTTLYEKKLLYYFKNNYFIKDDQTIIQDIIFTNPNLFYIHTENNSKYDNWFMFQRLLL